MKPWLLMFDSQCSVNSSRPVYILSRSILNEVIEKHYANTPQKNLLKQIVQCKKYNMDKNFIVTSSVIYNLLASYPERDGIVCCIQGMLSEESLASKLSPSESTVKLAQLKQFEGLDICVVTEDDNEIKYCKNFSVKTQTSTEALEEINKLIQELTKWIWCFTYQHNYIVGN